MDQAPGVGSTTGADTSVEAAGLHVLVAARWYPAFDNPGRGIFVADQVAALAAAGIKIRVVSWETSSLRGSHGVRISRRSDTHTPGPWLEAITAGMPAWAPSAWGAPGVPVTRLPAITPVGRDGSVDQLAVATRQAESLVAFGVNLASQWRIDLVHAHTGVPDGLAAISLADRLEVPLVVTEHDSTIPTKLREKPIRAAYRQLLAPGRRLLTVGPAMRSRLAGLLGVDEHLIEVVPNVVDLTAFERVGSTERDREELLWVGGRSANKGTDVLLAAFGELRADRPGLRLRLIGRAPTEVEEARLRALADTLGVAGAVSFEEPVARAGVAAAMARAAVFVHPSPFETFGVVAAEALAAGLPVAATPSGGVEEILGRDGACGVIAGGLDAHALAAAVRGVLARPEAFDPVVLRARVADRFAPDAVARRLIDLYARETASPADDGTGLEAPARDATLPLVIGLRRADAARRIASVPAGLATELVVVTAVAEQAGADAPTLPDGPHWIEIDPDRAYRDARRNLGGALPRASRRRRILRSIRHPVRAVRRRRLAARQAAMARDAITSGVRDVLTLVADGDEPVEILPLDGDDLRWVVPLLDARTRLYPSVLRGLVDEWDARGRPGSRPARVDAYPMLPLAISERAYAETGDAPLEIDYSAVDGVPTYSRDGITYLHPVGAAQQGLRQLSTYVRSRDQVYLDRARSIAAALIAAGVEANGALWIPYEFDFSLHARETNLMRAPWYSAMAQGQVLSLVSRLHELTGVRRYLDEATAVYASFASIGRPNGPWISWEQAGALWLEEYPGFPPDHTLNGFVFALYGIHDYYSVTHSAPAAEIFQAGLTTVDRHLPLFRVTGGVSRYCLTHGVQSEKYHRIHIAQLRQLTLMTGDDRFARMAGRFESDHA